MMINPCFVLAQQEQEQESYKYKHETLHTKDGKYDDSWLPVSFVSEEELKEAMERKSYLVAYLNSDCMESFEPTLLRNQNRNIPSRFMGIGTIMIDTTTTEPCKISFHSMGGEETFSVSDITDWKGQQSEIAKVVKEGQLVENYVIQNNLLDRTVDIYWINSEEEGKDDFFQSIRQHKVISNVEPKQSTYIGRTFIGHMFVAIDTETEEIVDFAHCSKRGDSFVIGDRRLMTDDDDDNNNVGYFLDPHVLDQQNPHNSGSIEQYLREYVFDATMEIRMALSDTQIHSVPRITDVGYEKTKVPPDLFQMISDFYQSSYNTSQTMREQGGGPLYNRRVIPTYHTPLPSDLKTIVFDKLKEIMEDWSGIAPLVGTSIYGVRTYSRGSYLHMHVDTAQTHVVSGIVHVHRQNLEQPWPLEIIDHNGKLQYVHMEVGDLVFYESAKLLHGRPHPLVGDSYANLFVHYKPITGWHIEF